MSIPITAPILMAPEVREAVAEGQGVVSVESAVITHGLPNPHNAQAVWRAARAARLAGAVSATVGVLRGKVKVGLTDDELRELGNPSADVHKIGVRDLAVAIAEGWTGGTTLAATAWIASRVGIRVVVTGGIGGVHREPYRDESGDLTLLSQAPVAVVCAGPKAICDLPATLERLETLSVPVVGIGTGELPGFYYNDTGISLDHQVPDEGRGARVFRAHRALERKGGILFVSKVPETVALERERVASVIAEAHERAVADGIRGKALTPFLLKAVRDAMGPEAVTVNLAVLESNASVGARLAMHLAREAPDREPGLEGA
jgi:pseudouridylate synthase